MEAAPRPDPSVDASDAPLAASAAEAPEAPTAGPAPRGGEHGGMRAKLLVIACVDYRFADALVDWLRGEGLRGQYDLRTHEGAALSVDRWLESAVVVSRLHEVEAVWLVDHEDCGAYRLLGEANTRANHVQHLKAAEARVQAWTGKPVRIFFHPLGLDGRGGAAAEEVG
jgi:hypothetical protein